MTLTTQKTDIQLTGWLGYLPEFLKPYAVIARLDRPIGWWLLLLPGWWSIILFAPDTGVMTSTLLYFLIGAIVLRASGCVINDMWDRDIDSQVARTAGRPLASGAMSLSAALIFLLLLSVIGLFILVQLPVSAWLAGIASLPLIILYPLAKRVTGWPQLVLGLTFSWGIFLGTSCFVAILDVPAIWLLFIGTVLWVIGYDTIYAVQDMEDDKDVGVRSSALSLGSNLRIGVLSFYTGAACFWAFGLYLLIGAGPWMIGWLAAAMHLGWQITQLSNNISGHLSERAKHLFISNRDCGLLLAAGLLAERFF